MNIKYFFILIILSLYATAQENITKSKWHFAFTSSISSYALITERKISDFSSIINTFGAGKIIYYNGNDDLMYQLEYLNYSNKNAYMYEGYYYLYRFNIIKDKHTIDENYEENPLLLYTVSIAAGYGWHYFNHSLLFTINMGYGYHKFQHEKPSSLQSDDHAIVGRMGFAYIF